jgi:serine/threonine protein kinase
MPLNLSEAGLPPRAALTWEEFGGLYLEEKLLGVGGNGRVFAGIRKLDRLPVAIKQVGRPGLDLPLREVQYLLKVCHLPGVAKLVDWHVVAGTLLMVFDRSLTAEGCSDLLEFVSLRGSLSEKEARLIFSQIAGTVRQLWQCGVLHGDIKAENILVDPTTLVCWLLDFGSATEVEKGFYWRFRGTVECSPPEWVKNGRFTAEGLTVWSLGVLLYEMVFGELPFKCREEIRKAEVSFGEEAASPACSAEARHLILSCLASDQEGRSSLEGILRHPWLQAVGSGETEAPAAPHQENAAARLETFCTWPASLHPGGEALCGAGFYYTGESRALSLSRSLLKFCRPLMLGVLVSSRPLGSGRLLLLRGGSGRLETGRRSQGGALAVNFFWSSLVLWPWLFPPHLLPACPHRSLPCETCLRDRPKLWPNFGSETGSSCARRNCPYLVSGFFFQVVPALQICSLLFAAAGSGLQLREGTIQFGTF